HLALGEVGVPYVVEQARARLLPRRMDVLTDLAQMVNVGLHGGVACLATHRGVLRPGGSVWRLADPDRCTHEVGTLYGFDAYHVGVDVDAALEPQDQCPRNVDRTAVPLVCDVLIVDLPGSLGPGQVVYVFLPPQPVIPARMHLLPGLAPVGRHRVRPDPHLVYVSWCAHFRLLFPRLRVYYSAHETRYG